MISKIALPCNAGVNFFKTYGSYADFITMPEQTVAELPDSISFQAGAALPVVGLTSLQVGQLTRRALCRCLAACLARGKPPSQAPLWGKTVGSRGVSAARWQRRLHSHVLVISREMFSAYISIHAGHMAFIRGLDSPSHRVFNLGCHHSFIPCHSAGSIADTCCQQQALYPKWLHRGHVLLVPEGIHLFCNGPTCQHDWLHTPCRLLTLWG